jgi:hypothetical protein
MASQALLNTQIAKGEKTIARLDDAGLDVRAAYWVFDEDAVQRRFTIAEETVAYQGTRSVYEKVMRALSGKLGVLPLRDVYVVSPNDPLVSLVRLAVSTTGQAISGISFTGNVVMGNRIPDMYVCRMFRPPIAAAGP